MNESAPLDPRSTRVVRLTILIAALLLLFIAAGQSTWLSSIDPLYVRETIQSWGQLGVLIYALGFSIGLLLYVPGTIFIVAAGVIYGPLWGSVIAFVVANIAVFVSFNLIRWLGGQPATNEIHPWLATRLKNIRRQPVQTIAFLRIFLWTAPALNYLLALTSVDQRHHLLGTLLGTLLPVLVLVVSSDWLLVNWFAN